MSQTQTIPPPNLARRIPWSIAPAICALIFGMVWLLSDWLVYGVTYYAPIVAVLLIASVVLGIIQSRSTRMRQRIIAGIGSCALTMIALALVYGLAWLWYAAEAAQFTLPGDSRNVAIEADPVRWDERPVMWLVSCETDLSRRQIEQFYRERLAANHANWKLTASPSPDQSTFMITEDDRWIFIHILDMEQILAKTPAASATSHRVVAIHSLARDDLSPAIGKLLKSIGRWW